MIQCVESSARSSFNLSLLKEGQLFAEEPILGCKCAARLDADGGKASEIEQRDDRRDDAVPQSGEQNERCGHER
jgi:hypothetical protein